jgi:acetate---CoA ligase (ADP-forming)
MVPHGPLTRTARGHHTGRMAGFGDLVRTRSVAVVGASPRNLIARIAIDNLRRLSFPGRVVGIHPRGGEVDGLRCHPTYEEADGPVDLALLAVGAPRLVEALETAAAAGVRGAVIPGAGANEGGRAVEAELRAAVDRTGMRVVGPNCMGFAALHERVTPFVGSIDDDLQPGSVALVSQSGSVLELFTALPWRVGFSHIVSVGNEVSVDMTEAMEFLVEDERTGAIGLFVEGVRRPDRFREALRRAAEAGKPVVALKVGRSTLARKGAVSHTGALAGDQRVFSAVLRDAGAIEVRDLEEMLALAEVVGKGVERSTDRVVYVGDSGGQANLFADLAADAGIDLPPLGEGTRSALAERFPSLDPVANPLDLWAIGVPEETYREGVALIADREPHLVVLGLDKFLARAEPEREFVRAGVEGIRTPGAVLLLAHAGSDTGDLEILRLAWERRIPVVRGTRPALAALAALARWRRWGGETPPARRPAAGPAAAGPPAWTEHGVKELLAAAGIPVTREREVVSVDEAVAAGRDLGYPVVAKTAGEGVAHKTESGGVRLGLRSDREVEAAARDLLRLGPRVLVAEERRADLEVIVGAFRDGQFGPCALIGLGGTWTEALGQAVVVAGPGSPATVRRALEGSGWGRLLLEGARGRRFPWERVAETALRLLDLVEANRAIAEIEINPLFVDGDDVVAVDALAVPAEVPYPPSGNASNAS